MAASRAAQSTATFEGGDPSTPTTIPRCVAGADIRSPEATRAGRFRLPLSSCAAALRAPAWWQRCSTPAPHHRRHPAGRERPDHETRTAQHKQPSRGVATIPAIQAGVIRSRREKRDFLPSEHRTINLDHRPATPLTQPQSCGPRIVPPLLTLPPRGRCGGLQPADHVRPLRRHWRPPPKRPSTPRRPKSIAIPPT